MTYADAHAQAEREWDCLSLLGKIRAADADDEGLSGFIAWAQRRMRAHHKTCPGSSLGLREFMDIDEYLATLRGRFNWLDRRAVAIQEEAAGRDDNDAAYDAGREA